VEKPPVNGDTANMESINYPEIGDVLYVLHKIAPFSG
jgi:hypothetical protein